MMSMQPGSPYSVYGFGGLADKPFGWMKDIGEYLRNRWGGNPNVTTAPGVSPVNVGAAPAAPAAPPAAALYEPVDGPNPPTGSAVSVSGSGAFATPPQPIPAHPQRVAPTPLQGQDPWNMSPEAATAIGGLAGAPEELEALNKEAALADELRNTGMPEGRNAGRVFVAANPLEFVGAGVKQYRGWKKTREVEKERDAILSRVRGQREKLLAEAIRRLAGEKNESPINRDPKPEDMNVMGFSG